MEIDGPLSAEQLSAGAAELDRLLIATNPDLNGYRRDNLLGPPSLRLVAPDTFERLYDQLMAHESQPRRNQLKIPRKLRSSDQQALVEQQLIASS